MQFSRAVWLLSVLFCAGLELSEQAKRDYYEVLGIDRNAKPQQIKKAFRKQAAKFHPDKNKEQGAEEKFKEINEAHEVLMDPEKRRQYDMFGHADSSGSSHSGGSGPGGFNFHFDSNDDILRSFFGHEFTGERPSFHQHFNQRDSSFHGKASHGHHQHQNFFSFNDFFEDEDAGFGNFFGGADPHRFGGGSSFFGSHFGGGHHSPEHAHYAQQQQAHAHRHAHAGWSHGSSGGGGSGTRCRTVTQRVGNMVTTYTQCS